MTTSLTPKAAIPPLHRTPSDSQMGTKFFRSVIEDGTTTGTRFRRSGQVEFANQTSESVVEIADFTFVENQKSILQNATLSVLVCFIDSRYSVLTSRFLYTEPGLWYTEPGTMNYFTRIAPLYASPFLSGALRIPILDSQPQPRSSPFPLHACTLPPISFQMARKFIDFLCTQSAQPRNLIDFPLYIYPFEDRGCREIRFRACGIDQKSVEAWAGMAEADSVVGEASVVTVSHRMKLTTSNSTNIARQRFVCDVPHFIIFGFLNFHIRFEIGNRDEEAPLFHVYFKFDFESQSLWWYNELVNIQGQSWNKMDKDVDSKRMTRSRWLHTWNFFQFQFLASVCYFLDGAELLFCSIILSISQNVFTTEFGWFCHVLKEIKNFVCIRWAFWDVFCKNIGQVKYWV
ncbi:hypothetical protein LXL04_008087 [Taraxacum kok-saghyz]